MGVRTEINNGLLKRIFPLNLLSEDALNTLLPKMEIVEFPQKSRIYNAGDIPDFLYFILSGQVTLSDQSNDANNLVTCLTNGDHFGSEALSSTDYRINNAVASDPVRLLKLGKDTLEEMRSRHPKMRKALTLIYRTDKLSNRLFLPWLGDDEKILLISRRHPFFLFLRLILLGGSGLIGSGLLLSFAITPTGTSTGLLIFAFFILLLGIFLSIWAGLEWTNDYFFITAERVLVQKKMVGFFDSRQESPYSAILSTGLESSFWGRQLGFGTIHLRAYTGDLTFKHLPFPEIIHELLEHQRHRAARDNQQQDHSELAETLQARLEGKPRKTSKRIPGNQPGFKTTYASGSILDILARFFGLRIIKSGEITYRTHWWILLGKTIIPALILLAVFVFVLIKWAGLTPSLSDADVYGIAILVTLMSWSWWLYQYLDWHNDVYIITSDQLIDVNRKPLGKEERRSAPVRNIQTVQFKRKGIIGLVLNFGTVRIQIGNEELTFDNVYDPASIQAEIFANFKRFNQHTQKMEQEKLADWIKAYDEMRNGKQDTSGKREKNG
jgi:hypothetical protein